MTYTIQGRPDPKKTNSKKPTGGGSDKYGEAEPSVNLNEFQELLDRLEGSKKRQVRQKSVEDRRGTFAQGLASMMSNF